MAEDQGNINLNSDENSDFERFNSDDIGDRESIVPDSDPGTSDIEISSVGSSDLSKHVSTIPGGPVTSALLHSNAPAPPVTIGFRRLHGDGAADSWGTQLPRSNEGSGGRVNTAAQNTEGPTASTGLYFNVNSPQQM